MDHLVLLPYEPPQDPTVGLGGGTPLDPEYGRALAVELWYRRELWDDQRDDVYVAAHHLEADGAFYVQPLAPPPTGEGRPPQLPHVDPVLVVIGVCYDYEPSPGADSVRGARSQRSPAWPPAQPISWTDAVNHGDALQRWKQTVGSSCAAPSSCA